MKWHYDLSINIKQERKMECPLGVKTSTINCIVPGSGLAGNPCYMSLSLVSCPLSKGIKCPKNYLTKEQFQYSSNFKKVDLLAAYVHQVEIHTVSA